ncbi:RtcB family protein [Microbulbifer flavimaris]|uniref:tRNA-splicing ligase RtcB n=1 Tax=Microbulbifer flavimaris TaxID=1781068 RepID=A0ABX4I257_9GAMM|nr:MULTISPECIES: RtcB family protein [Microbulbifer]KUJ84179.1 RNA-splicing ligase RtcB [Microbulbifer sp. ZGT114]PCO06253.1 RtcB family protein [Microbulbifer flavimaris]
MPSEYPLKRQSEFSWRIDPFGKMRVPGIVYADEQLIEAMDDKVFEQLCNVATLPGIVQAAYAMPDAHWGYGFPIGGVAAFDADQGGVVSAGGVGFDISCGVRALRTGLTVDEIESRRTALADALYRHVPVGVGSTGRIHLNEKGMNAMLLGGARWAVEQGYGEPADLEHIEERGCMQGADPGEISARARKRQQDEMGTLGSGNHYLEVQRVAEIYDPEIATAFGLRENDAVVFIHCGSRGLGHQIGTEFLKYMVLAASSHHIELPDRELACAPINSELGQAYLGAMRAAINCAFANRQIITHLTRQVFAEVLPQADLTLLFDVSHNTCKLETHTVEGRKRKLYVHRKGATRAFGPGHPDIPETLRAVGQPVLIGGSMGTESHILAGSSQGEELSFNSACHGAGRAMSRHQATKRWRGRSVVDELGARGIVIRSPSMRGVAEEAPGAYKDVRAVVDAAQSAGLARKVARVEPLVCIKG